MTSNAFSAQFDWIIMPRSPYGDIEGPLQTYRVYYYPSNTPFDYLEFIPGAYCGRGANESIPPNEHPPDTHIFSLARTYGIFDLGTNFSTIKNEIKNLFGLELFITNINLIYSLDWDDGESVQAGIFEGDWGDTWGGLADWSSYGYLLLSETLSNEIPSISKSVKLDIETLKTKDKYKYVVKSIDETKYGFFHQYTYLLVNFSTPVILIHGFWSDSDTWGPLKARLDEEKIKYFSFDYSTELAGHTFTLGDIRDYAEQLDLFIKKIREDEQYTGPFDIVCHSMGALVSRWYMSKIPGGAENINQWIGLAPANHGCAYAYLPSLQPTLAMLLDIPQIIGNEVCITQLQPDSPFLSNLNYDKQEFDINSWKSIPESLPNVSHKIIVGINTWIVKNEHQFLKTWSINKDIKGLYPYRTSWGDIVISLNLSLFHSSHIGKLEENKLVGVDCYSGPAFNHCNIHKNAEVINRVIEYLKDPLTESKNNYPTGKDYDDHRPSVTSILQILLD
jgi:pimeloyl-ACP methyl ester carboxylesterase